MTATVDAAALDDRPPDWLSPSRWVVVAVLACLVSVDLGEHRWPGLEPIRFVGFAAIAITGAIVAARQPLHERHRGALLLLTSFVWVAAASAISDDPVGRVIPAGALVGTYLVGSVVARSTEDPTKVFSALLCGATVPLVIGAVVGSPAGETRWIGWSEEPNGLAVVAALALVLSVITADRHPLAWFVAGLAGITLFTTNAAIPAAAGLVGAGVWLTRRWRSEIRRGLATAIALAASTALAAIYWLPTEALPGDGYNLETLNERTRVWSFLMEDVAEAPILGHGARASHDLMARGAFDDRVHWGPTHAHNAWVELTVAGGWPAGMLFAAGLALTLVLAVRRRDDASLALILTIALLAVSEPLVREPSLALLVLGVAVSTPTVSKVRAL